MSTDWQEATRTLSDEIRQQGRPQTGYFAGRQVLLLTTTGAKSGEARVSPLAFSRDGDRYVVTASKGGAPTHPSWYFNLVSDSSATLETGGETIPVRATLLTSGAERQRLWDQHVELHPGIGEYPKKTDRVIPIVAFERTAPD